MNQPIQTRLKFECWNCAREFSLLVQIDERPDLLSECPYCSEAVLIELDANKKIKTTVFKSDHAQQSSIQTDAGFPKVIPTRKPDSNETSDS